MEAFIDKFGYIAIVIGTFLEGEAILLVGGLFAVMGYLHPVGVIIAAFFGALAGDLASYFLGSLKPRRFLRAIGIVRRHEAQARKFLKNTARRAWCSDASSTACASPEDLCAASSACRCENFCSGRRSDAWHGRSWLGR